jgi:hypothetical protein
MNKITIFLLVVVMALSFCLGMTMKATAQQKSFVGVMPFVTSTDRVGFWDQTSGRVYMYDSNIQHCLFVGQMRDLGLPIQVLASSTTATNL